ncbi:MAG TPA: homocysteine biosynthesis protein [Firmicutes bacterium]|nr:homocysteine biosynthesis protein [Bacillota bacterium]
MSEKTYEEINEKIKNGKAVVVTAEEIIGIAKEEGLKKATKKVDVVTTGTFGAMCSSGAFLNFGHPNPKMRMTKVTLNGVPAYSGIAAVDAYIGATELPEDDPRNSVHPGEFRYGGGHVIEDLIAGKPVHLEAQSYGTDDYPQKKLSTTLTIDDLNYATMFNPRNCYQNYNVATNLSDKTIYSYMGILKPNMGNITYSSAGQLSPLLNDPYYKTIGIGTRIFLGGGVGYVAFHGTQHSPCGDRNEKGVPTGGAGTMALIGDMKQMSTEYIRGLSITGYGVSLAVGVGVPIPILNEEILEYTCIEDKDIQAEIIDYGGGYQVHRPGCVAVTNYRDLRSGKVTIKGKEIRTGSLSSYAGAKRVASTLKQWIQEGRFTLSQPAQLLPSADSGMKNRTLEIK